MVFLRNLINISSKLHLVRLKNNRSASTVADQLTEWTKKLSNKQICEPESSIRNFLAHILQTRDLDEVDKNLSKQLSECQVKELEGLAYDRLAHIPIQYIIKEWDFRELKGVSLLPPVFIPRPETEELVSHVIADMKQNKVEKLNFLEIGCGSGVISISLLREFPGAIGTCFDQNQLAVELTKVNAEHFDVLDRLKVQKYKLEDGSLSPEIESQYDLIVSNPPYLLSRELLGLEDHIKLYEDLRALDGGRDGLIVINNILKVAENYLNKNGSLWMEVHPRHPKILRERYSKGDLSLVFKESFKDYCGKDRFIKFIKY